MQLWRHESRLFDYVVEHATVHNKYIKDPMCTPLVQVAHEERLSILADIFGPLQRMQPYLVSRNHETQWFDQLKSYLNRLRALSEPQTPMQQFNHLYVLRTWLLWAPSSLLATTSSDSAALVVLAHLYATALALEPMFPDIGSAFIADMALRPLEEVIRVVRGSRDTGYESGAHILTHLIQFPVDMVVSYKARREQARQRAARLLPPLNPIQGHSNLSMP
jgi:hypothetical protein